MPNNIEIDMDRQTEVKHLRIPICVHCNRALQYKEKHHIRLSDNYKYTTNYYCPYCKVDFVVPGLEYIDVGEMNNIASKFKEEGKKWLQ